MTKITLNQTTDIRISSSESDAFVVSDNGKSVILTSRCGNLPSSNGRIPDVWLNHFGTLFIM
jgi:hypothetical protein